MGKNTDLFLKDHDLVVRHILNMKEVKALDKKIYTAVEAELQKISCVPPSKVDHPAQKEEPSGSIKQLTHPPGSPRTSLAMDSEHTVDDGSIADALDYCPWCKERVGDLQDGICCETCLQWFHFNCEGITEEEYESTESDQPYLCKTCHLEDGSLLTDSLIQEGM